MKNCCVVVSGRMDWEPDTPVDQPNIREYTDRPYKTLVLPRDRLVSALLYHIYEKYSEKVKLSKINNQKFWNACIDIDM